MSGTSSYRYYTAQAVGNDLDNVLTSSSSGIGGDVLDGRGAFRRGRTYYFRQIERMKRAA